MAASDIKQSAHSQIELLEEVANFKMRFYSRSWAKYEDASVGTLRLMPPSHCVDVLARDYAQMRSMIYGNYPSWEEIIELLAKLEEELNALE